MQERFPYGNAVSAAAIPWRCAALPARARRLRPASCLYLVLYLLPFLSLPSLTVSDWLPVREIALFLQSRSALAAYADFLVAAHFVSDAHRPARSANQLDVRQRDAALLLRNAALNVALRIGAHVLFHHHDVLDQNLPVVGKHAQHTPFLTLVASGDHLYGVVAPDIHPLMLSNDCSHNSNPVFVSSSCAASRRLQNFRSEGHDLQKLLVAKLTGHRTKDAGPDWLASFIDQYSRVLIEANIGTIAAAILFVRAHNDRFHHGALLNLPIRRSFFHAGGHHVSQSSAQSGGTAQGQNHLQLAGAGIVGYFEPRSHHYGHSSISQNSLPASGLQTGFDHSVRS